MPDRTRSYSSKTHIWVFALHSLSREYGTGFITKIALAHPVKTIRGLLRYRAMGRQTEHPQSLDSLAWEGGPESLVGLGFCLKPLDPPCPSGRPNHDCLYFEEGLHLRPAAAPESCRRCFIREAGFRVLRSGCGLYIMTSAADILEDLLLPSIRSQAFKRTLLGLCPYSIEPFRIALAVCGVETRMFPYGEGDCRDYRTWREADKGFKKERTSFHTHVRRSLMESLAAGGASSEKPDCLVRRKGNILFCHDS
jgi:hypothetical protein